MGSLCLLVVAAAAVFADEPLLIIEEFQMKIADCVDCGMSGAGGSGIQVSIMGENGGCRSGFTGESVNFERNTVASIVGEDLGKCNHFGLSLGDQIEEGPAFVVTHRGTDDISIKEVTIVTSGAKFTCEFNNRLDNDDHAFSF